MHAGLDMTCHTQTQPMYQELGELKLNLSIQYLVGGQICIEESGFTINEGRRGVKRRCLKLASDQMAEKFALINTPC
jgi:hypothetical protein